MIDGISASRIARMEHEELVRSMAPVRDYDEWLTHEAGNWQAPRTTTVFAGLKTTMISLAARFQHKPASEAEGLPAVQEAGRVTG